MKQQISSLSTSTFSNLGIAPSLLVILAKLHYEVPTPIQEQAIPVAIQGKDIAGIAQTGTGKTLAFGIPMIQRIAALKGRGLVVLPTRELALQVEEELRKIGGTLGLRTVVLIGGTSLGPQISALAKNPHIIIATPGRLIDHLKQKNIKLDSVRIVVLDEADRMLDMGFAPQIEQIFRALSRDRQTMLFSATMPQGIMKIAQAYMKMPIRVEVAPSGTLSERVTQEVFIIHRDAKNRLLDKLLSQYLDTALVFTRTKHGAKKLAYAIRAMGHSAAEIHSNRSLGQRRDALGGFKSGKYRVLVATDIASRGIDVVGIGLVINYDLPTTPEDYVHRIGRTARAGSGGHAISFATPEQHGEIRAIERLIRQGLTISQIPDLPAERPVQKRVFSPGPSPYRGHRVGSVREMSSPSSHRPYSRPRRQGPNRFRRNYR